MTAIERKTNSPPKRHKISRRQFLLITAALAGMAIPLPALASQEHPDNLVSFKASPPIEDKIKNFEDQKGTDPLTQDEARDHIDRTIELMMTYVPGFSATDISNNIYLLRPSSSNESFEQRRQYDKDALSDPFVSRFLNQSGIPSVSPAELQLLHDYTNYSPTSVNLTYGWTVRGGENIPRIYINFALLNELENRRLLSLGTDQPLRADIYRGSGSQVRCEAAAPAVLLRSVVSHEATHYNALSGRMFLEPNLAAVVIPYYQAAQPQEPHIDLNGMGYQENFQVSLSGTEPPDTHLKTRDLLTLNELSTDATPVFVSRKVNLPYFLGYGAIPYDVENMDRLMQASEIDFNLFQKLYRESNLTEFYRLIALGAQVSKEDSTKLFSAQTPLEDLLKWSIRQIPLQTLPIWADRLMDGSMIGVIKHFPSLDPNSYIYTRADEPTNKTNLAIQGCLN